MFRSLRLPFFSPRQARIRSHRRAQMLYRNTPAIGTVEYLEDHTLLTNYFGLAEGFLGDVYRHISEVDRGNETPGQLETHQSLIDTASELTGFSKGDVADVLDDLEKYYSKIEARYGDLLRAIFGDEPDDGSGESPENSAPEPVDISDKIVTIQTDFTIDTSAGFTDEDEDDTLTYEITWDDSPTLPDWVDFDTATGALTGNAAAADAGTYAVEITATDEAGESATNSFDLTVQTAPNVSISNATYNEEDGNGNMIFTVSLDSASSEQIKLTVTTEEGTAQEGVDYTATTLQLTFAPGETSKTVNVPILADALAELDETFALVVASVDAGTVGSSSDTGTGTITNDDPIDLTVEIDEEDSLVESSGILVTNQPTISLRGNTEPGATVTLSKDGDSNFNDGTVTADSEGNFTLEVTLSHNEDNLGVNNLQIRATLGDVTKTESVDIHYAVGTVVRIETSKGDFDIELFDEDAPETVANFKSYFAAYAGSAIHRSIDGFIIQGGGFDFDNTTQGLVAIPTDDPVDNEFDSKYSNVRGTLSTALQSGNIDSFTSGWFINTVDNLFLDNVPHTVFGRVIGDGMEVVDAISDTTSYNLNGVYDGSAFANVPLTGFTPFTATITGTVSLTAGSDVLTGVNTAFLTELVNSFGSVPGSAIRINGQDFVVRQIVSNTQLQLDRASTSTASGVQAFVHDLPTQQNLVLISQFDILLGNIAENT